MKECRLRARRPLVTTEPPTKGRTITLETTTSDSNMIPRRKIKTLLVEQSTPRNLPQRMNHLPQIHRRNNRQGNVGNITAVIGLLMLLCIIPLIALQHYYSSSNIQMPTSTRVLKANQSIIASAAKAEVVVDVHKSSSSSSQQHQFNKIRQQQQGPALDSGWDDFAQSLYQQKVQELETYAKLTVTFPGHPNEPVIVSYSTWWWNAFPPPPPDSSSSSSTTIKTTTKGRWERDTFIIFDKYVTADTIVVDFGMWIGPTVLYNAPVAKHVYGIDADPVSYATAQRNVYLNHDKEWSQRITLEAACVSAPDDVGPKMMKSRESGNSMSGIIANHISNDSTVVGMQQWQVQCYTLPEIFERWGLSLDEEEEDADPVFIKMDIESYECHLIPSLYEWLVDAAMLPTIYVSFHNQIAPCTNEQWNGVLKVMKLYQRVTTGHGRKLSLQPNTTDEEFAKILRAAGVGPTFVLTNDARENSETTPLAYKK